MGVAKAEEQNIGAAALRIVSRMIDEGLEDPLSAVTPGGSTGGSSDDRKRDLRRASSIICWICSGERILSMALYPDADQRIDLVRRPRPGNGGLEVLQARADLLKLVGAQLRKPPQTLRLCRQRIDAVAQSIYERLNCGLRRLAIASVEFGPCTLKRDLAQYGAGADGFL